ncbi:MAG: TatD family hydrolase [Cellvibrionaceae bacterium]|nr:TatD family hydrolase [Cellvibrionaceae bacterium]
MLVDSHCHLDRLNLEHHDNQLASAVKAATNAGVGAMLCVCISESNKNAVLEIAEQFPQIVASVGVHPCDVQGDPTSELALKQWADHPRVVALGETGLDYYHSKDFVSQQRESFARHLRVAGELGLPVIVHTRDAREDTLALISEHGNAESAGVLHCFTEDWSMARRAMDLNYYISISGIVTFKNAEALREVVKQVPLERLLVETDSPYLAPIPYRGKSNEPAYVRAVAEYIAELKGVSYATLVEVTGSNFFRLFSTALPLISAA